MVNLLAQDLDHVLAYTPAVWDRLRGSRIFITGGTGFFGTWLLESFAWANDRLKLGASAVVLTRDASRFALKAPHLVHHPSILFHAGDVLDFEFPTGPFSHVIHAATEASAALVRSDPRRMLSTIVDGTERVLRFAGQSGATRLLLTSSGAVYGRQPAELSHVPEGYVGAPDPLNPASCYGEGKRMAELLCSIWSSRHGTSAVIARCYAFLGPHLPIDTHFAAGNFIRDALAGQTIQVNGDGTAVRSYLYAADLAAWLWNLLVRGESSRAYNVGSPEPVTVADLAHTIAGMAAPSVAVQIAKTPVPGQTADRYVPDCTRANVELQLQPRIGLTESIRRTLAWHMEQRKHSI